MRQVRASRAAYAARAPSGLLPRAKAYPDGRDSLDGMGGLECCGMAHRSAVRCRCLRRLGPLGAWRRPSLLLWARLPVSSDLVVARVYHGSGLRTGYAGVHHRNRLAAPSILGANAGYRNRVPHAHQAANWNGSFHIYAVGAAARAIEPGI